MEHPDEAISSQYLRDLAHRARIMASSSDESEKERLLALADELDKRAADLESGRP